MNTPTEIVVITDANLLINLIHVDRIALLGNLQGYQFVVPEAVVAEITQPEQRERLIAAIDGGSLSIKVLTEIATLSTFAELREVMGAGEAACLALAVECGWSVASDEKSRFRREVIARLGAGRLLTTPDVFVLAIRLGLLSIEEADADKAILETQRFTMKFRSFADLVGEG